MLVLELKLEKEHIDISSENLNRWIIPAVTTLSEALALSASNVLDIEYSDLKSGYRLRHNETEIYADIYLYDSLSSGAGYANRVAELIEPVLDGVKERLENCDCETSCPNCLQNFWNQSIKENLDRKTGLELLNWVRNGILNIKIDKNDEKNYISILKEIVELQDEPGNIIQIDDDYWIEIKSKRKKIKIYPAMCSMYEVMKDSETILIPDRLFKVSIAGVWDIINKFLG